MKIKTKNLVFAVLASVALLFSSCNNIIQDDDGNQTAYDSPTIKLSVNQGNARTATPLLGTDVQLSDVSTFKLVGKKESDDAKDLGSWTKTSSKSAYENMCADELPIAAGEWTFTLTATVANARSDTPLAIYSGSVTGTIGDTKGQHSLSFVLSLDGLSVSGNNVNAGTASITVTLGDIAGSQVKHLTVKLFGSDGSTEAKDSDNADASFEQEITSNDSTYTYSKTLNPGVYIAEFTFYATNDTSIPVAKWREAININQLGASSSKTFSVADLDAVYNITYVERLDFVNTKSDQTCAISEIDSDNNGGNPAQYSRRSKFTLNDPSHDGYTFWRWVEGGSTTTGSGTTYTSSDSDSDVVTNVEGFVGNKVYCAEFISEAAKPRIGSVKIFDDDDSNDSTGETQIKVGHTLTAKAFDTNGAAFKGNVVWKWLVKVDENETVELTSTDDVTTATSDDDGQTTSYLVPAEYANATITAVALQEYIVDDTISKVFRNKVAYNKLLDENGNLPSTATVSYIDGTTTASSVYSSFDYSGTTPVLVKTSAIIGKGDLNADDITLKYGSDGNLFACIGKNLDGELDSDKTNFFNFYINSGNLKDANTTAWTIPADSSDTRRVKIEVTSVKVDENTTTSAIAPAVSKNYTVTAKFTVVNNSGEDVGQYEVLTKEISDVPLHVQANAPDASAFTFRDKAMVSRGKLRFKNTNPLAVVTENYQYSFDGSTWADWKTLSAGLYSEFTGPGAASEIEVPTGAEKLYVRVVGTEFADTSNSAYVASGADGYIKASDAVEIENWSSYIGTLVRLSEIAFDYTTYAGDSLNSEGNPEVGTQIALTLTPDFEGQTITTASENGYVYTWTVSENSDTGSAATFNLSKGEYAEKTLIATVVVNYPTVEGDQAEDSETERTFTISKTIAKGKLDLATNGVESKLAYYNASAGDINEIPGAAPEVGYLKVAGVAANSTTLVKNHIPSETADETVSVTNTDDTLTFAFEENAKVVQDVDENDNPKTDSDGNVLYQATTKVLVSATGYNTEEITVVIPVDSNVAHTLLRSDVANIPYGHVKFNPTEQPKLQYAFTNSSKDADWIDAPVEPINRNGSYSATNAVLADGLFATTQTLWVRYKTGKTPIALSLKGTGDYENESYVGTLKAAVTLTIVEGDTGISTNGNSVIVDATGGYTDFMWYVDGEIVAGTGNVLSITNTNKLNDNFPVEVRFKDSTGEECTLHATVAWN